MSQKTPAEICEAVALDFKSRKITHQKAGEAIGKSKAVISNQISGKKPFSKAMAELFAKTFGYNIDFLLYGAGELLAYTRNDDDFWHQPVIDSQGESDYSKMSAALTVCEIVLTMTDNELAINAWNELSFGNYDGFMENLNLLWNKSQNKPRAKFFLARYLAKGLVTSDLPRESIHGNRKDSSEKNKE